ncbi:MAG TPA: hypothetical protein VFJ98_06605 [Mycobacteriales bacterium]|nr:hypothetical protein [Mycobacteriales bacterium]
MVDADGLVAEQLRYSAWLSHVPADRFDSFWSRVAAALRPGGRVVALDELPARAVHEEQVDGEVAVRTLQDGTRHEIKVVALVVALCGIRRTGRQPRPQPRPVTAR